MALPDPIGAVRILLDIEAQHNHGDLSPVGTFCVGIKWPEISTG
jgi:hypothetical protein